MSWVICAECGKRRTRRGRGLCGACYQRARRALRTDVVRMDQCPTCGAPMASAGIGVCGKPACLAAHVGITYRQLDYWVRQGYLHPAAPGGTGYARRWPDAEIETARRMGRLVAAGLPVAWAARFARQDWPVGDLAPGITVVVAEPEIAAFAGLVVADA